MARRELERFGAWLKSRRPRPKLEQVTAELVVAYLRRRAQFKAKSTLYDIMCRLRRFGNWLVEHGHWTQNPLRWLRGPKIDPFSPAPQRINGSAIEILWRGALTRQQQRFYRHRYLGILALLYGLGLRRGELVLMNCEHWDAEQGTLLVQGRKTGRERRLAVPPVVEQCLTSYLPERQNHLEQLGLLQQRALWVNRHGGRLSGPAISHGIHTLARRLHVCLGSLHQFRHTCASDLLESGAGLHEVQKILGHQVISSTMRYLHISDPQRREAITRHPLNDWLKGTDYE
jgi:site-specific recombinase XerD